MAQNALLVSFAIINVIVVGIFTGTILRQYLKRHRESQLYWTIALVMAFVATLAYILRSRIMGLACRASPRELASRSPACRDGARLRLGSPTHHSYV